ncbi:MAG: DUF642 domain-containing protein [Oligoflexales bacterium]
MRLSIFLVLLFALGCGKKASTTNANLASEGADGYRSLEAEKAPDEEEDIIAEIPAVISGAHLTCTPRKSYSASGVSVLSCAFSLEQADSLQNLDPNTKLEMMIDDQLIVLEVAKLIAPDGAKKGFLVLEIESSDLQIMQEKVKEDEASGEEPQAITIKDTNEVLIEHISRESGGFQILSEEYIETEVEVEVEESEGSSELLVESDESEQVLEPEEASESIAESMPDAEEELLMEEPQSQAVEAEEMAKPKSIEIEAMDVESKEVPINLVSNGSFELDSFVNRKKAGKGFYEYFEDGLIDWEKAVGTVVELHNNFFGWTAAEGNGEQWVELCSNLNSGIKQEISTIPGEVYILRFFFGARPFTRTSQNHLKVEVGGSEIFDMKKSGFKKLSNPNWKEYTVEFVAEETETSLMFYSEGCTSNYGTFIDQISVMRSIL